METQATTIKISNMTWLFSPAVIEAFDRAGMPVPRGLRSFILKVLSMKVLQNGEAQITLMGLELSIIKEGKHYFVRLLEENM